MSDGPAASLEEQLTAGLERRGVDIVFGLPGTQNVALFDALRQSRLRTIVATHELGAGFMANGYARASGRVGVIAAIQGPGFAWTLPALAEARHDSAPLLLITGTPDRQRPFALQALDQAAMAAPVAKAVIRGSAAAAGDDLNRALDLALSGEPGPVVFEYPSSPLPDGSLPPPPEPEAKPNDFEPLLPLLRHARRPLFYVGLGAAAAAGSLRRLVEQLGAPVATTLSGRGILPEDHPLALPVDQTAAGIEQLNRIIDSADLVLVFGAKLTHNGTGGFRLALPPDRLVHVDASAPVLGANYPARLALVADVPSLLDRLAAGSWPGSSWTAQEIAACREAARAESPPEPAIPGVRPSTPAAFFQALRTVLPPDAILTLDSGLHQMLARRHFPVLAPRGMIAPSDFQSMGFGLPAAIGAALAAPGRPVVGLIGDGGLAMSGLELLTAAREQIPVTIIVFTDGSLGLIREQQIREFGRTHGVDLGAMNLEALAAAVGARYLRLGDGDPVQLLGSALPRGGDSRGGAEDAEGAAGDGPVLVEVPVGDSLAMRRQHVAGYTRAAVRRALGPRLLQTVKRWLR